MSEKQIATYMPADALESVDEVPFDGRTPTPAEVAEMSRALQMLANIQGPAGVMTTTPDELTSNLQTFITWKAEQKGRLEPGANDTLEAKFDERDILGWAGS